MELYARLVVVLLLMVCWSTLWLSQVIVFAHFFVPIFVSVFASVFVFVSVLSRVVVLLLCWSPLWLSHVPDQVQSGASSQAKHGGAYFSAVSGSIKDPIAVPRMV